MISVLLKVNKKKRLANLIKYWQKKKKNIDFTIFGNMTMTKRDMTV